MRGPTTKDIIHGIHKQRYNILGLNWTLGFLNFIKIKLKTAEIKNVGLISNRTYSNVENVFSL